MDRRQFLQSLAAVPLAAQTPNRERHVVIITIDGFTTAALRDEKVPVPAIRGLARRGAIADAMEPVNPTVTWPNHTSIITGVTPARHQVVFNGLLVRTGEGKPVRVEERTDKPDLVKAPTLYDAAHAAGLTTAEVDWVAIQNANTVTYPFPEVPPPGNALARELTAANVLTESDLRTFEDASIVWRDELWTIAGQHIIEKYRPNLLMFHLLTTDSVQHEYGTSTLASSTALAFADTKVQRLLDSLQRAGIAGRTTVFLLSDHGFRTFHHQIHPNALLRRKGLVQGEGGALTCDAWAVSEGGTALVYITRSSRKAELMTALREMFSAVPGIAEVVESSRFAQLGYPAEPGGQMADLVLAAAEGYAFSGAHQGEPATEVPAGAGSHGYLNTDRAMDAVFIASGAGIRRGAKLGRIRNLDVAPTAARLLGIEMKGVEGQVLTGILA